MAPAKKNLFGLLLKIAGGWEGGTGRGSENWRLGEGGWRERGGGGSKNTNIS